jgi:hypothetical protein
MAFKEITGGSNIKSYWPKKAAERKVGDEITGIYRKRMERKNPDGTDSVLYLVETSEGMVGVNASATITRALEQIPYDTTVKIVFNGQAKSQKTGRSYNDFKVYMDDSNQTQKEEDDSVDLNTLDF